LEESTLEREKIRQTVPERDEKSLIMFAVPDFTRLYGHSSKLTPSTDAGGNQRIVDSFSNLTPPATTPQSHHGCRFFSPPCPPIGEA
jgi:hypothetical protein